MNAPIPFTWSGEAMTPPGRFACLCDKQFVVGETYPLVVHEDRSTNSHNHFFAAVHEAWKNLPERLNARFPTSEHLRKWALIKAGYADERSIACNTADEALRVAAFIKPMDDFAVVVVADATIKVFTAKSQSARAMDKKTFQDSKQAVLEIASELIGVDVATLQANTNSSHAPSPPKARAPAHETKPAPEDVSPDVSGAGPTQSPEGLNSPRTGEPEQIVLVGNAAPTNQGGLPEGWERDYAAALRKAAKPIALPKRAAEFWNLHGGWDKHDSGPTGEAATAIYKAFVDHFDNHETRDAILHEFGAGS